MMRQIMTIALTTFRQYIAGKLFWVIIIAFIANLVTAFTISSFSFGVPEKVALDVGMGIAHLVTILLALIMGVQLLSTEIESRTIYMTLTSSVKRSHFFTGKILGLTLLLVLASGVISSSAVVFYLFLGGAFSTLFLWAILFSLLESLIILNVALLLSLLAKRAIAVLFTLVIYAAGQTMLDPAVIFMAQNNPFLKNVLRVLPFIIPDFSKFNLRDYLIYRQLPPDGFVIYGILYGGAFLAALYLISQTVFKKKDLN